MCYARFSEWLNAFFQSSQKKGESIAYVYVLFCFLFLKRPTSLNPSADEKLLLSLFSQFTATK